MIYRATINTQAPRPRVADLLTLLIWTIKMHSIFHTAGSSRITGYRRWLENTEIDYNADTIGWSRTIMKRGCWYDPLISATVPPNSADICGRQLDHLVGGFCQSPLDIRTRMISFWYLHWTSIGYARTVKASQISAETNLFFVDCNSRSIMKLERIIIILIEAQ